jgi:AcrR family transcriptional regulator
VDAILQATIQVLVSVGKERLTTTRVAARAGVSVGTLYQYFPNKSSLLKAALQQHMSRIRQAIDEACRQYRHAPLLEMASGLIAAYLASKMENVQESAALYAVSSDIDGAAISKASFQHVLHQVSAMFATAKEGLNKEPEIVASVVLAALNGVARRILEAKSPEKEAELLRHELVILVHGYLHSCINPAKLQA